jgi:hypothetical protein
MGPRRRQHPLSRAQGHGVLWLPRRRLTALGTGPRVGAPWRLGGPCQKGARLLPNPRHATDQWRLPPAVLAAATGAAGSESHPLPEGVPGAPPIVYFFTRIYHIGRTILPMQHITGHHCAEILTQNIASPMVHKHFYINTNSVKINNKHKINRPTS